MITGIGHAAFAVRDIDASLGFYCGRLGLKEAFRLYKPTGETWIVYIKVGQGSFLELFPVPDARNQGGGSYQHLCLTVDDIHATLKEIEGRGLPVQGEPTMGQDGNWQYWLTDPDGNRIELMQIMPDSLQAKA